MKSPLICGPTLTEVEGTASVLSPLSERATDAVFSSVEEVSDSDGAVDSLASLDSLGSSSSAVRESEILRKRLIDG